MADAVPVAKRTGAHCVAIVELAKWLEGQGVENVSDPNLGGTVEFDWGWIKLVPAWHTNTLPGSEESPFSAEHGIVIGPAAGLVIKLGETTVYHAGDTCLFSDMKLIAQRSEIDVACLPIGGHYTMDRHDAVVAAEFVGAGTVHPDALRHLPGDRDRRRGLQGRGRGQDLLEGGRAEAGGDAYHLSTDPIAEKRDFGAKCLIGD